MMSACAAPQMNSLKMASAAVCNIDQMSDQMEDLMEEKVEMKSFGRAELQMEDELEDESEESKDEEECEDLAMESLSLGAPVMAPAAACAP